MEAIAEAAEILAEAEGLTAHANAARIRRKGDVAFEVQEV